MSTPRFTIPVVERVAVRRRVAVPPVILILAATLLAATPAQAVVVPVDPRATYLRTDPNDTDALSATPIDLEALGFPPGTLVRLTQLGSFDNGKGIIKHVLVGVFSKGNILRAAHEPHRVPGAIEAGTDFTTPPTLPPSELPRDIPEDFLIEDVVGTVIAVPEGATHLFVAGGDTQFVGDNIDQGFALRIEALRIKVSNEDRIVIPSGLGAADLYPSNIEIGGAPASQATHAIVAPGTPGRIRKMTVALRNLGHTYAADLDILLVGPGGHTVLLMSDAGGNFPLDDLTLAFDDDAELSLPEANPLRSGTYKPTNGSVVLDSQFPAPAPSGPYGTSLAVFKGTSPAGRWQLFVRDDLTGDAGAIEKGWELNILIGPLTPTATDFDGDGRADPAVYRDSTGVWTVQRSLEGIITGVAFGDPVQGDVPVPGDYDHDGVTDLAVYRPATGQWFVRRSADGSRVDFTFGPPVAGDVPTPADYDGDGSTDPAIYRAAAGAFLIRRSSDGTVVILCCAAPGDVPMPADYDGDGKTDLAVYRPTPGAVLMLRSSDGRLVQLCCADAVGDLLIPADYDGDGKADLAKYRPTTGEFTIFRSSDFQLVRPCCGDPAAGDLPVVADYDGDGKADVAVYRVTTGNLHILRSTDGALQTVALGTPGRDLPAIRAFQAPPIPPVPPPPAPPPDPEPDPEEPTPPPSPCKPDLESFFPGC